MGIGKSVFFMAGNLLSAESEGSLYQQINTCSRNLAACSPVVVADAGDHLARAAHVHLLDGQLALVVADHAEEAVRVEVEGADVAVLAAGHHHVVRHAQHRVDAVRVAGELVAVQPVLVLAATLGVRTLSTKTLTKMSLSTDIAIVWNNHSGWCLVLFCP